MLDVFNNNAFGVVPLTDAINKLKFQPGYIGSLGLFATSSVATLTIAIEEKDGQLILVPPSARGGPGTTFGRQFRTMRNLTIPHFEINDAIMADEVQGVRAWGSETAVEMVMGKVAERQAIHSQSFAATEEYHRIGAVKGVVTYADGTTLNLFTEFGVAQETEIDWDLDNATPVDGVLRKKCAALIRQMAGILDGIPFTGVMAVCGDAFFDDLIAHKEVRATYLNQQAAGELRTGYVKAGQIYGSFEFGGINWINYRGAVGATTFVNTDKCHFIPLGVPGLFKTVYGPADYVETVNTLGQRLYSKQYMMDNGKGVNFDTQSNGLFYCTRPRVLIPGRRT